MLDIDTFTKGKAILEAMYRGFELNEEESILWYEAVKTDVSTENFIPLIKKYIRLKPAPTCPFDLLDFGRKWVYTQAPLPSNFADILVETAWNIDAKFFNKISDDGIKNMVIGEMLEHTEPIFDTVITSVISLVFSELLRTIRHRTENIDNEVSFLKNKIRQTYQQALNEFVSTSALTLPMFKSMLELVSSNIIITLKEEILNEC